MAENELFEKLADAILHGETNAAVDLAKECIERGFDPLAIILDGANMGMKLVGDLYEKKELYVPELMMSAYAMQAVFTFLKPLMKSEKSEISGTVVLGTVAGDLHSIGKNIVRVLLETGGFTVIDLGENVSAEAFICAAKEHKAEVIGMSSLLTTTMHNMGDIIKEIKAQGLDVLTVIGGAPVNETFREIIGADGYAEDGNKAVRLVKDLLRKRRS